MARGNALLHKRHNGVRELHCRFSRKTHSLTFRCHTSVLRCWFYHAVVRLCGCAVAAYAVRQPPVVLPIALRCTSHFRIRFLRRPLHRGFRRVLCRTVYRLKFHRFGIHISHCEFLRSVRRSRTTRRSHAIRRPRGLQFRLRSSPHDFADFADFTFSAGAFRRVFQ